MVGPLLRYVGQHDATVWVETDQPCEVEVLGRRARTFALCGHHYALVCIEGLEPATNYPYEVALDGHTAWPDADAATFPPSSIRTRSGDDHDLRIAFGSCRVAYPHERPFSLRKDDNKRGREVDALYAMALRMRHQDPDRWPDLLLWLGDQVYADEISPGVREFIDAPPATGAQRLPDRRGRRLRGVRAAVLGLVARPGHPVADLHRAQRDDLRRPRRDRRLEHVGGLGAHDPAQALVARADRQRLHVLLGLPAPGEPLPGRARGGRDLAPRRAVRGRHRAPARAGRARRGRHHRHALHLHAATSGARG